MSSSRSTVPTGARGASMVLAVVAGALALLLRGTAGVEPDVRRNPAVEAIAQVMPAVVNIGTETIVAVRDPFEDLLQEFLGPYHRRHPATTRQFSLGSGVIIDEAGYLVTNDHVVRRATRIRVRLGGGNRHPGIRSPPGRRKPPKRHCDAQDRGETRTTIPGCPVRC